MLNLGKKGVNSSIFQVFSTIFYKIEQFFCPNFKDNQPRKERKKAKKPPKTLKCRV